MTRPASHREQIPERRCDNCVFSHLVAYKDDLLCFHGDDIRITGKSECSEYVELNGEDICLMDGEEYSKKVWAGRIVYSDDVCDEWKQG